MSNPNGPVRRRRIAGESTPAVEPVESKRKLTPKAPKPAQAKKATPAKEPKPAAAKSTAKTAAKPVAKPAKSTAKTAAKPVAKPVVAAAAPKATKAPKTTTADPINWRFIAPLGILALAAVVFGAFFAVQGIGDYRETRGVDKAHAKAATAASAAVERVFTYQWDKLDEHNTASKKLMTPSFQKDYDTIAPSLNDLAPQRKIVVMAQARTAAPVQCSNDCLADKVSVLVFLDQARLLGDSKTPTVFGNRVVVDMVKRNGAWLVNDIKAL